MDTALVVVQPFSSHRVGDLITDNKLAEQIISGEHARNVVRIALADDGSQRQQRQPILVPPARAASSEGR